VGLGAGPDVADRGTDPGRLLLTMDPTTRSA